MKTAGLEISGEAEVMEVTKATRNALSHLEETGNGFDRGIRQAGFQVGQDAVEMFFESSRELAERFEPRTVGPAQPPADGKQVAIGQYSLESLAQGDGAAQDRVGTGQLAAQVELWLGSASIRCFASPRVRGSNQLPAGAGSCERHREPLQPAS